MGASGITHFASRPRGIRSLHPSWSLHTLVLLKNTTQIVSPPQTLPPQRRPVRHSLTGLQARVPPQRCQRLTWARLRSSNMGWDWARRNLSALPASVRAPNPCLYSPPLATTLPPPPPPLNTPQTLAAPPSSHSTSIARRNTTRARPQPASTVSLPCRLKHSPNRRPQAWRAPRVRRSSGSARVRSAGVALGLGRRLDQRWRNVGGNRLRRSEERPRIRSIRA